jgi:hypothetical protein
MEKRKEFIKLFEDLSEEKQKVIILLMQGIAVSQDITKKELVENDIN